MMKNFPMTQIFKQASWGLFMLALLNTSAWASWPTGGGGANDDQVIDTVTSSSNNTYVLGQFQGTAFFDGIEVNSVGLNDLYVLQVKPNRAFDWVAPARRSSHYCPATPDTVDADHCSGGACSFGAAGVV